MHYFSQRIIAAAAGLVLLAACDNAVRVNPHVAFVVKGDAASRLYPVAVTRDSEDVHIELKDKAPTPEVFSIDTAGRATPYNSSISGHVVVVPGKFERIELRHAGDATIEISGGDPAR